MYVWCEVCKSRNILSTQTHEIAFLAPPQYAVIMQMPSIGWPIYIRVVRMIIETGAVSGSASFIIAITSIAAIYVMINELRHEIVYWFHESLVVMHQVLPCTIYCTSG